MRNSKRAQNQKKKLSRVKRFRKQRGSSDPDKIKITHFTVYYDYMINNFEDEGDRNGQFLTRGLTPYELGECQDWMRETRDIIIEDHAPQFADLEVGRLTQLEPPYHGKRFSLFLRIRNKSTEEAIDLIRDFMDETAADHVLFDWPLRPTHESHDQNRYVNTTRDEIEIEEWHPAT
jgi:hypothetical protein